MVRDQVLRLAAQLGELTDPMVAPSQGHEQLPADGLADQLEEPERRQVGDVDGHASTLHQGRLMHLPGEPRAAL